MLWHMLASIQIMLMLPLLHLTPDQCCFVVHFLLPYQHINILIPKSLGWKTPWARKTDRADQILVSKSLWEKVGIGWNDKISQTRSWKIKKAALSSVSSSLLGLENPRLSPLICVMKAHYNCAVFVEMFSDGQRNSAWRPFYSRQDDNEENIN